MFIVTADATEAFGPFTTREAAEYFVGEMPARYKTCRVIPLQTLESIGVCPISGDGAYRHFMMGD